jgi:folate-binding protein YgfZ
MENPLLLQHEKMGANLDNSRVPLSYTSLVEEYWAVRKKVGIADLSHLGRLAIKGKDRIAFLNGLLTNDISKLKENGGVHSVLLNTKARVLSDLYLYNQPDRIVVDTSYSSGLQIKNLLDQFIITEDVKIEDSTQSLLLLSVQGPLAAQCVREALGMDVQNLGSLESKTVGPSLIVARDRTGHGGYDLFLPRDEAEAVWQGFLLKGRALGLEPIGSRALEVLRLEKGLPKYGVDVDENTIVLEAGFGDAISYSKGCYMGQEVVARATHIGRVNRRLVQLQLEGQENPKPGSFASEGKDIGVLTSSAFSPALSKIVALGYVQRDYAAEGKQFTAQADGMSLQATVTKVV